MFSKFTEKARRAIFFARYEASQLPTGYIETEHLLLGLMREDALLKIKLINQHGSAEGLRKELEASIPVSDQPIPTSQDLPLSKEAKHVLSLAVEEADQLKHRLVDSGHLVLGIFATKGRAAEALVHQGIARRAYREALAAAPEYPAADPPAEARPAPQIFPATSREIAAPSLRNSVSKLEQLIEQTSERLSSTVEDYGDRRLKRKPWTRKEALGNLIDWATTLHGWIARALSEPKLTAPGYPQDEWVVAQRYGEVSWAELRHAWLSLNRLLLHVLRVLPQEKVSASCRIGIDAPKTLGELIDSYIGYCEDVIGQILAHG